MGQGLDKPTGPPYHCIINKREIIMHLVQVCDLKTKQIQWVNVNHKQSVHPAHKWAHIGWWAGYRV